MENRKIGAFIAERRKESGLTQQALADRLGLTNKAVSKWETGDGLPDITILPALAENLGVTVDELLAGERRSKTPEIGEQTRKYLEERKRKQYKIAVMALALIVVLAVSYMIQGTYYFGLGRTIYYQWHYPSVDTLRPISGYLDRRLCASVHCSVHCGQQLCLYFQHSGVSDW